MRRNTPFLTLLFVLVAPTATWSATVHTAEQAQARRWVGAKFEGQSEVKPPQAHLMVRLKSGGVMKNMVTTRVYYVEMGALPLKIVDQVYDSGLYCPSTGEIDVQLPSSAKSFDAVFGVDSNRVTSFYSNAGRGRVVGSVKVGGKEAFRSAVMREGMAGVPVNVKLGGAKQFTLGLQDRPGGVIQRVNFNQADWADAKVTLENGQALRLGDLRVGPLRAPYSAEPPFSFRYDGRDSREFLKAWRLERSARKLDENKTEHTMTYRDPATGLQVRCIGIEYRDFPVVEWKLLFKNTGDQPTPILENIQAIDTRIERDNEGEFLLHHNNGATHSLVSISNRTDYAPRETQLEREMVKKLGSKIGLPASHDLPYFNIEWPGEGIILAVGWPGQWAATLARDKGQGLHIQAGQELTHFRLLPGEEVRSPLMVLLFWKGGDWIRAQNLWRRWMIKHSMPLVNGTVPPPQHAAGASAQYVEVSTGTEENQLAFVKRYLEERMKPDYWWIDAGWYDFKDYWLYTGTWFADPERFPRGLSPISSFLHQNDMKMILWFSPELVTLGSWLHENHPEWLLKAGGTPWWTGHALLQGEVAGHVDDSGLMVIEDVAAFGTGETEVTVAGKTYLADGKWHLVTATRAVNEKKEESELRIYIDGQLEGSAISPNTDLLDDNDHWGLGRQYQTRGLTGEIDDLRTFRSALSPGEVEELFLGVSSEAPLNHYPLDGNLKDVAGGLDGTLIGTSGPSFVPGAPDKGKALRFNNDYGIKIPNRVPKNFTLSCWVRMDAPQPPPYSGAAFRLFDLGNPEAVKWLTDHIDGQIKEHGVDLYRHDGIPTLSYWRANDAEDRQGITEIRHIDGYLEYWDELLRRNPHLRSDICSGGGSRNEVESMRRAVPLWRSDYAYEPTGMQTLTYGMSFWFPYYGTGTNAVDSYTFRSQMAPAIVSVWDLRRRDADWDFPREMLSQWREVADYYYGDFYPLTTYRIEDDVWMAWQFDVPEKGEGMVQAFRRPKSSVVSMNFKLRGLAAERWYALKNFDEEGPEKYQGKELMESGLLVELPQAQSAAVITYKRVE